MERSYQEAWRCWLVLLALVALLGAPVVVRSAETPANPSGAIGRQIDEFALRDYRGKTHRLADFAAARFMVVAFIGTECPLVNLYAPRLVELHQRFADQGVVFIGVNANRQDSLTEVAAHARRHGIAFPVLKDPTHKVADLFAAERTPQVFVLDENRQVRYVGRIDDQYGVGYQRPEVNREDLAVALNELLADSVVSVSQTESPGCLIGRTRAIEGEGDVTYANQISRLFQNRCIACHRAGQIAPFPLDSYEEAVGWAETIREVVRDERMPPWHASPEHGQFNNDARLTDAEKQLIEDWVAAGAPEGDPAQLPPPLEFSADWQIDEPDQVIYMSDEPFRVAAEGVLDYQYFVVDPGFQKDRWVAAAEPRPGCRAVVHHIIVFVKPPGEPVEGHGGLSGFFAAAAPGSPPLVFQPGMAKKIPAGSKLIFQMHYTPNGTEQLDRSSLGLIFADPDTITQEVRTASAANPFLVIPPQANNFRVDAYRVFRRPATLLALYPHMHLRGKSFRYVAEYPDGSSEILLDVPAYDFNWQNAYVLSEPKPMPEGTTLHCIAHFDNSSDNLWNPDPNRIVTFGEQTFDEMMIGFFDAARPVQATGESGD